MKNLISKIRVYLFPKIYPEKQEYITNMREQEEYIQRLEASVQLHKDAIQNLNDINKQLTDKISKLEELAALKDDILDLKAINALNI